METEEHEPLSDREIADRLKTAAKLVIQLSYNGVRDEASDRDDIAAWEMIGTVANEYLKIREELETLAMHSEGRCVCNEMRAFVWKG